MVRLILLAMFTLLSCRDYSEEQKKIVEFQLIYDTQDNIWKINNNAWVNNSSVNGSQCTSNEICAESLQNCTYQFNSNIYQFIEVTPVSFQNQPQITINQNTFKITPDCNHFNDTDLLKFKIKAQIQ